MAVGMLFYCFLEIVAIIIVDILSRVSVFILLWLFGVVCSLGLLFNDAAFIGEAVAVF